MGVKIGTLLDKLWKQKELIKQQEEVLKKSKQQYLVIEDAIFNSFKNADIDQASGKLCKASRTTVVHPTIHDHGDLATFIYRNKAIDLLQNRVAKGNWQDRLDARPKNKPIPGIRTYEQIKLNIRKK